jgi:hypothetical protein
MHNKFKSACKETVVSKELLQLLQQLQSLVDSTRHCEMESLTASMEAFNNYLTETNFMRENTTVANFIKNSISSFLSLRNEGFSIIADMEDAKFPAKPLPPPKQIMKTVVAARQASTKVTRDTITTPKNFGSNIAVPTISKPVHKPTNRAGDTFSSEFIHYFNFITDNLYI